MDTPLQPVWRSKTFWLLTLGSLLSLSLLCAGIAYGAQVTLAWDPSTDPTISGYKLYWGTQSGQYALLTDVGNSTSVVVSSLEDGATYYFAATAYDGQGDESAYSNEISYSVPVACTYSISPASLALTALSATGSVTVTTQTGCVWAASSVGSWLTITSGAAGTGSGTIGYAVTANTGTSTRILGASVAGQVLTVTQAGAQDGAISTADAQTTASRNPSDYFDTVQKAYIAYYHRAADPAGLLYWAGRLYASGGNLTDIIEAFADSTESRALYGTINSGNVSTLVNGIYRTLFNRDAESGGLNYYVDGFNTGKFTAASVVLDVLYGAQNQDQQSVNNKLAAANLFTRTIDPDLDGTNLQATYAGEGDATSGRNFFSSVTWDPTTVPTQDETTAYMESNISDPGDPILNQGFSE